ncbi:MAG: sporulation transcription factor Spo0A [Clostridia bacterium]|nr:sporulation transcription factor Spo0A [Clostridia bacterium]
MEEQKVVVLQENQSAVDFVVNAISEMSGFTVVGSSCDGEEGLNLIEKFEPDFLITGIVLKSIDGFTVLERLQKSKAKAVVVSSFTSEPIISRALSSGAVYYIAKPFKSEVLKSRLLELCLGEKEPTEKVSFEMRKNSLDEKISKIFISVGIPPHIKGYYYLREGVKMAVEHPEIINNITKKLYPKIGEKFETSASKVERAIRHAIEVAWNRGRIETINNLLGIRAYVGGEKPTNGEFIALIADKMLLEGA